MSESVDAVKGFTKPQMLECLIAPNRTAIEFQDAFEALRSEAWYLHRKENDAFYFSNIENLQKRIDNRAESAPQPKIDGEMKRRLESIFRPLNKIAYQEVHALPRIDEIKLNGPRVCLVLSPDSKIPPQEAQRFWESVTEKNNFCVVTGDGTSLGNLEDKTRRIWAIARVLEETGGDKSPHKTELEDEAEQAEIEFNSTVVSLFNRVYYPTKSGLTPAKLAMTFTANQFQAEDQIEKALTDVGASKLIPSLEEKAEMLMTRAEEMLWPGTERRVPGATSPAGHSPTRAGPGCRPKGWSSCERSPKGKDAGVTAKTATSKRALPAPRPRFRSRNAITKRIPAKRRSRSWRKMPGRTAGSTIRPDPTFRQHSPVIPDTIFETDETVLWFLAVDPDGQHETGEAVRWSNKLTLTHQPQDAARESGSSS